MDSGGQKHPKQENIALAVWPVHVFLICLFLLGADSLAAQGPAADWRQRDSEHFRWHYPAEAADWVESLAPRLEAIRERVSEDVGYAPRT